MGDVSPSYCDILVSHLVKDESGRGGNETSYYNVKATRSGKGTDEILISNCD
jgi:hypothetical protein